MKNSLTICISNKKPRITLLYLTLIFSIPTLFPVRGYSQATGNEDHILVALRMIGHELLLESGDSSSRILPIEKTGNKYEIRFENDFHLVTERLSHSVEQVFKKMNISESYLVEVLDCSTRKIVYSYEITPSVSTDEIACKERDYPKACYQLYFSFTDTTPAYTAAISEEEHAGNRQAGSSYTFWIISCSLLLLLSVFLFRTKKIKTNTETLSFGASRLDLINMTLLFENTVTELTSKESDLLAVLIRSANKTIDRDILLHKVWGDEGDYEGRTLDVFISRLRKKLEADERIRIVNIRGVGYKLVVNS